ncbi:dTDP-4-dehydrorhamnose reductase family protein [Paenibacillus sp. Soil787]|uniref:dTDP-4-dehydrorhamnose reductase family protein n=1 Tax=Paenibacillus sp. Soil787 TaxID=1736411 RepID=UPI0007024C8D|nr:SDR family oxidoreductase [Paenibacillus sp. Soil787]KRF18694.1 NAD(P)-dependent oxidoreductase [Paenibacillus sp. Soil787]
MTRKLLIFGGQGMLGHLLVRYFGEYSSYHVQYTTRDKQDTKGLYVDASDPILVDKVIEAVAPDVIVNCVGILNQFAEANPQEAYWVNGLLPHRIREAIEREGGKLIHISTDCVFSGNRGDYKENDQPEGTTVYARSKALGEVTGGPHLTIRTSIIGPEIRKQGIGLLQWFLQQQGIVKGYNRVMWNGVTTLELAKAIHHAIEHPVFGLLQLTAPQKISKYELLHLFQQAFDKRDVTIISDEEIRLDRTLINSRDDFTFEVSTYPTMLKQLADWMGSS